jgi:UDP-N-acetylmuramate dehydrogenase
MVSLNVEKGVSLKPFVTLRAGGSAQELIRGNTHESLSEALNYSLRTGLKITVLGCGSNVLPADQGVPGLVVLNRTKSIDLDADGNVIVDSGCPIQDLFLRTAQAGFDGLQFAVGIPGTVGGALASNAGAYRKCISDYLVKTEVATRDGVEWVEPSWLKLRYRDSLLRHPEKPDCIVTRIELHLPHGDRKRIFDEAREYQRQRIGKQPPSASAGSFFKNVNDSALAQSLHRLPEALKKAGVVPAGYLLEDAGLRGYRHNGAMFSKRHGNFILNVGGATATDIRHLANQAKEKVYDRFGVMLEEEVLYIGDWPKGSS